MPLVLPDRKSAVYEGIGLGKNQLVPNKKSCRLIHLPGSMSEDLDDTASIQDHIKNTFHAMMNPQY